MKVVLLGYVTNGGGGAFCYPNMRRGLLVIFKIIPSLYMTLLMLVGCWYSVVTGERGLA